MKLDLMIFVNELILNLNLNKVEFIGCGIENIRLGKATKIFNYYMHNVFLFPYLHDKYKKKVGFTYRAEFLRRVENEWLSI